MKKKKTNEYIRTKDGIYWNILDGVLSPQTWVEGFIKAADTIEELCDYLVVSVGYKDPHILLYTPDVESVSNIRFWFGNINYLYGAIWTDKGLIYVAKMNEKGELELLPHTLKGMCEYDKMRELKEIEQEIGNEGFIIF